MLLDSEAARDVYVIFQGESEYTFSNWFKAGFKHVFCIERQALGWLCFDPSRSDMVSTILPAPYPADIMTTFRANNPTATVVNLSVKFTDSQNYPRLGVISCVTAVQYYLGVYWPFIFTPYQLYRRLSIIDQEHIRMKELWVTEAQNELLKMQHNRQKEHLS